MKSSKRNRATTKEALIAFALLGGAFASMAAAQNAGRVRRGGPWLSLSAVGGCGSGNICAFGNVIYNVQNMDKSTAFYHDALGLTIEVLEKQPIPSPFQNMVDAPGVKSRRAVARIPGAQFQLEFTEYTGVPNAKVGPWRMQDPGNLMLAFRVRDLDSTLAAVKKYDGTTLTTGGKPLWRIDPTSGMSNKSIFMRDPDGFIFELRQFYPETVQSDVPANSTVISADVAETIAYQEKTKTFWDAVGGVDVKVGTRLNGDAVEMQLGATEGPTGKGKLRGSTATIAGTKTSWRLFQFTGQPRRTLAPRPIDPSAPALQFRIHDLDAAMRGVMASGGEIVSRIDKAMPHRGAVFVRDPNGLLIVFDRLPEQ